MTQRPPEQETPSGSCLLCGYDKPWAIWFAPKGDPLIGLCTDCRVAPTELRALATAHQQSLERERALRELLYTDWKARVQEGPTDRWYFDELLERRLAANPSEEEAEEEGKYGDHRDSVSQSWLGP